MRFPSVILGLLLLVSCGGDERTGQQVLFDSAWQIVNETFPGTTLEKTNWDSLGAAYRENLNSDFSDDELCDHINTMLFQLNVSHTFMGPLSQIQQKASPYMFQPGSPGFDIRIIDEKVVITRIDNIASETSNLKAGTEILSIDGIPVSQIIADTELMPPFNDRYERFLQTEEVLRHLYGEPETNVSILLKDIEGLETIVYVTRKLRDNAVTLSPEIPPIYIECEWKVIEDNVGYIRFNAFQPEDPRRVITALDSLHNTNGLIIDLRGNNGGSTAAQRAIAGRFFSETVAAAILKSRDSDDTLYYFASPDWYSKPVVMLVDEVSISAAEMFPSAMQALGRAVIIGNRTPGAVMGGNMDFVSDSIALVHPIFTVKDMRGVNLEGYGVVPDIPVLRNRESLSTGIDNQLEEAINYLNK